MSDMVLPAIIEGTGGMETRTVTLHVRNDDGQIDCEFHIKISRKPVQIAPIPEFEWVDGTPFATVDLGAFFANEKTFTAENLPEGFAVSVDGKLTGPA
jgi:hypothetical protein